jgi:hypothetical protein
MTAVKCAYTHSVKGFHMTSLNRVLSGQQALWFRLAVGGIFGLLIATLTQFDEPSSRSHWRETLAGTLALIAFICWAGAGAMRRVSLGIWTALAGAFVFYILWQAFDVNTRGASLAFEQVMLIFPLLFISHELVSSGDQAGQPIASYETYFDEAWKRGVQLALAILFTLLFWGILWLGAALLGFIGFDWLKDLLGSEYFSWPATGLAFGAAVHLGDVQTKLLANVRSLILGVLSWLLPVITIIGAIFAVSLLVSGLAPLWATKAATATLLSGCIGFVLLINAAYQQGDVERSVPFVLKWCVWGAAILLLVFAVLAAWSLGLRINQYGLSPDRVYASVGVIIAVAYGIGYVIAVFLPRRWMAAIEPLNIGLAIFKCALFIAVITPIASPERLSVADQAARLKAGKVSVAQFDWWLLKDDTGKYGRRALTVLSTTSNAEIATKAKAALNNEIGDRPSRYQNETSTSAVTKANLALIPIVFPVGATLPESFLKTDFSNTDIVFSTPECLRVLPKAGKAPSCKAALLDLNGDNVQEVIIRDGSSLTIVNQVKGIWVSRTGFIDISSFEADFDAGKLRTAPTPWQDLIVGEKRTVVAGFFEPSNDGVEPESEVKEPPSK